MGNYNDILTLSEAADLLQLNPEVLRRKLANGEVPGRKLGKSWRLSREQLVSWVRGEIDSPGPARKRAATSKPTRAARRPKPAAPGGHTPAAETSQPAAPVAAGGSNEPPFPVTFSKSGRLSYASRDELLAAGIIRCSICHQYLPLDSFSPDKKSKTGRRSDCKSCVCIVQNSRKQ